MRTNRPTIKFWLILLQIGSRPIRLWLLNNVMIGLCETGGPYLTIIVGLWMSQSKACLCVHITQYTRYESLCMHCVAYSQTWRTSWKWLPNLCCLILDCWIVAILTCVSVHLSCNAVSYAHKHCAAYLPRADGDGKLQVYCAVLSGFLVLIVNYQSCDFSIWTVGSLMWLLMTYTIYSFSISTSDCTLLTAIEHMITVLKWKIVTCYLLSEITWDSAFPILTSHDWLHCVVCSWN